MPSPPGTLPPLGRPKPPPPALGLPPPVLGLPPPVLGPLPPEELELLDPELPLDELGELVPLVPPELGDDAPELEGDDVGIGIEGVLGVLAETHPINTSINATIALAAKERSTLVILECKGNVEAIRVVASSLRYRHDSNQKTTQSYQSQRPLRPHSGA